MYKGAGNGVGFLLERDPLVAVDNVCKRPSDSLGLSVFPIEFVLCACIHFRALPRSPC